MARQPRKRSKTGIYHVMLRGIDKRSVFLEDNDKLKFLEGLRKAKEIAQFKLYAYCLMDNHIHLLMRENEEIGTSIKRITVSYVIWHNHKHGRIGHLFQNRFLSEPVETEAYLINVNRYIHQNPVKAGLVEEVEDYPWSSYKEYELAYQNKDTFIDANLTKAYFNTINDLNLYINEPNNDRCLDYQPTRRITDTELATYINKKYNIETLGELPVERRNDAIRDLYCKTETSIRQLARVLRIGKNIVENAVK